MRSVFVNIQKDDSEIENQLDFIMQDDLSEELKQDITADLQNNIRSSFDQMVHLKWRSHLRLHYIITLNTKMDIIKAFS